MYYATTYVGPSGQITNYIASVLVSAQSQSVYKQTRHFLVTDNCQCSVSSSASNYQEFAGPAQHERKVEREKESYFYEVLMFYSPLFALGSVNVKTTNKNKEVRERSHKLSWWAYHYWLISPVFSAHLIFPQLAGRNISLSLAIQLDILRII